MVDVIVTCHYDIQSPYADVPKQARCTRDLAHPRGRACYRVVPIHPSRIMHSELIFEAQRVTSSSEKLS